jgi:hypothetical protein
MLTSSPAIGRVGQWVPNSLAYRYPPPPPPEAQDVIRAKVRAIVVGAVAGRVWLVEVVNLNNLDEGTELQGVPLGMDHLRRGEEEW